MPVAISPREQRVLDAILAEPIPQSLAEICARVTLNATHTTVVISRLLARGLIQPSNVPWRIPAGANLRRGSGSGRFAATADERLASGDLSIPALEAEATRIIAANGPDRVAALRVLIDIKSLSGSGTRPPAPDSPDAELHALTSVLQSAGRPLADAAFTAAFPPEAPDATPPAPAPNTPDPPSADPGGDLE